MTKENQQSPSYVPPEKNRAIIRPKVTSGLELELMRLRNNPKKKEVGHFTGRCGQCGSRDLFDDNLAYGCNGCGSILGGN